MAWEYTDVVFDFRNYRGTEEHPFGLNEFAVLLVLADRADKKTGECYGGYFNLALDAHLSKSTLKRALINLEALELIKQKRALPYSTYCVNMVKLKAAAEVPEPAKKPKTKKPMVKYIKVNGKRVRVVTETPATGLRCHSCNIQFASVAAMEDHFDKNHNLIEPSESFTLDGPDPELD